VLSHPLENLINREFNKFFLLKDNIRNYIMLYGFMKLTRENIRESHFLYLSIIGNQTEGKQKSGIH
jgi:hypothetical protein